MSISLDFLTFDDSVLDSELERSVESSFACVGWVENRESEGFGEYIPFEVTSLFLNELLEPNVGEFVDLFHVAGRLERPKGVKKRDRQLHKFY